MKLNISHKYTKVEEEDKINMKIAKKIINIEKSLTVEIKICPIEVEQITIRAMDKVKEVDHETTIDMMIGETTIDMIIGETATDKMIDVTIIGKNIEETITDPIIDKIMEETIIGNRDIELEAKVGISIEIIIETIQGKGLNEVEIQAEVEVEKGNHYQDLGLYQRIEVID